MCMRAVSAEAVRAAEERADLSAVRAYLGSVQQLEFSIDESAAKQLEHRLVSSMQKQPSATIGNYHTWLTVHRTFWMPACSTALDADAEPALTDRSTWRCGVRRSGRYLFERTRICLGQLPLRRHIAVVLQLSRLLALSYGEASLTDERWEQMWRLEQRREERLQKEAQNQLRITSVKTA